MDSENNGNSTRYPYTDLDLATCNRNLIMLKACLPMLRPRDRHPLVMYIKLQEFLAAMRLKDNCPIYTSRMKSSGNPVDILNFVSDYLNEDEKNTINGFKEMLEMIELMKTLNDD